MRIAIANQGEIRIDRIDEMPAKATKPHAEMHKGNFVISHSKSGHHHLLGRDVEVLERTEDVPAGARILYAIVKEPTELWQDAAAPHQPVGLDPGIYEMRIKREYDPFAEQARQVAD
ncbi:MAG: hypothetical protein AAFQ38_14965 [Pseudomonadota bacterium]